MTRNNKFDPKRYEDFESQGGKSFEKIKRKRPDKEVESRSKGRKLNHRTKKKKDSEFTDL